MTTPQYDVVAVGNAIVDLLVQAPEDFLAAHQIERGAMTLIDEERATYLTSQLINPLVAAGGSAGNSATGVASFGGSAAFLGVVADDELGHNFTEAFRAVGAVFNPTPRQTGPGTARCMIVVTPDGQRSMSTYLGAAGFLTPDDIDPETIKAGAITFLEGYLFDRDDAKAAFVRAAEIARAAHRKVALTLSDTFCVDRHRAAFRHLVAQHIDILLCNEGELRALYEIDDFDDALALAASECEIIAATRSEKGSVIAANAETFHVKAAPVARVIDTTGAGDQYAAGFLFGLAKGRSLRECGALGSLAAGEVISHMGPRPETNLAKLAASRNLAHAPA